VIGGTSFFDRKEVADAVAYLRLAVNIDDEIALRRIINYPARGIGRTTILRVAEQARATGLSFRRALEESGGKACSEFLDMAAEVRRELAAAEAETALVPPRPEQPTPIGAWAARYFERIGLEDEIRKENRDPRSAEARVSNLRDVLGTLIRYERRVWDERLGRAESSSTPRGEEWEPPTLSGALSWLALDELNEEEDERDDRSAVLLMTLHSAKGLEFNDVFLVGLEEGMLPHARSIEGDNSAALSEERRLLYVGITRARQRLTLSCCRSRKRAGSVVDVLPSRYLKDIPVELLEVRGTQAVRAPEESAALRQNFFAQMKEMLNE
jgi:DNA helicase-2/ATP-dependent DNA helicase PcrA